MPSVGSENGLEACFGAEVADAPAFTRANVLEFGNDFGKPLRRADWSAGNDAGVSPIDIADDCVHRLGKPKADARVDDLVRRGIPAMRHHQFARRFDGTAHRARVEQAYHLRQRIRCPTSCRAWLRSMGEASLFSPAKPPME